MKRSRRCIIVNRLLNFVKISTLWREYTWWHFKYFKHFKIEDRLNDLIWHWIHSRLFTASHLVIFFLLTFHPTQRKENGEWDQDEMDTAQGGIRENKIKIFLLRQKKSDSEHQNEKKNSPPPLHVESDNKTHRTEDGRERWEEEEEWEIDEGHIYRQIFFYSRLVWWMMMIFFPASR